MAITEFFNPLNYVKNGDFAQIALKNPEISRIELGFNVVGDHLKSNKYQVMSGNLTAEVRCSEGYIATDFLGHGVVNSKSQ